MRAVMRHMLLVLLAVAPLAGLAQSYPGRPVRVVVPFPPGGANDLIARVISTRLAAELGQPFVVENRAGASGMIGVDAVAKAAADGYTLAVAASSPLAIVPAVGKKTPYDVTKDLAPVSVVANVTIVLVANEKVPARSVPELVGLAKSQPESVKAALNSLGSMHHLLTELFQLRTGVRLLLVPYKGMSPAITDLLGGQVDIEMDNLPALMTHIRSGRLRALAVASPQRSELLPDVPTFQELGMPDLTASAWFAMMAPAGTPAEAVERLSAALSKILSTPRVREQFSEQGAVPAWMTPAATGAFISEELARWTKVVRDSGLKIE